MMECASYSAPPPPPGGQFGSAPGPSIFESTASEYMSVDDGEMLLHPRVKKKKSRQMRVSQVCAESTSSDYEKKLLRRMEAAQEVTDNIMVPEGKGQSLPESVEGVDFTLIPQMLDTLVEQSGDATALRSTTIKTGDNWTRNRQENLLTRPKEQRMKASEIKKEKNKAFDLLDALSRSGSLPVAYSELHVIIAVTHCFDKDVMRTVVCDNINPIEKLERSTLLIASAVHGVPARELVADVGELQRLEGSMPLLLKPAENGDEVDGDED